MNAHTVARARALHMEAESLRAVTRSLVERHGASMETALIDHAVDTLDHIARTTVSHTVWVQIVDDVERIQRGWETLRAEMGV